MTLIERRGAVAWLLWPNVTNGFHSALAKPVFPGATSRPRSYIISCGSSAKYTGTRQYKKHTERVIIFVRLVLFSYLWNDDQLIVTILPQESTV